MIIQTRKTLTERIDAAMERIKNGDAAMRIPVDVTDPDVVLEDCKQVIAELLGSLKGIMRGFEEGVFVRDISKDADSSWAVKLLPFIVALGKAKAAIAKAEGD